MNKKDEIALAIISILNEFSEEDKVEILKEVIHHSGNIAEAFENGIYS